MQEIYKNKNYLKGKNKGIKILPVIILWTVVILAFFIVFVANDKANEIFERPYLFPWVLLTGFVLSAPAAYLWFKDKFCLYHPLIFPACFYFLPSFFIGGLILTAGWNEPYFLSFVQDQETNLPLTMQIIIIGFAGLIAGFIIPYGGKIGQLISRKLPVLNWESDNLFIPCLILLFLGFVNNIIGFFAGVIGFQKLDEVGSYDGIIFLSSLFFVQAGFLLWLALFRRNKVDFKAFLIAGILLSTSLIKAIFSGNRGGLLHVFLLILLSYIFAGKEIKFKQGLFIGIAMFMVVIAGMIYGTTFRQVKGTEARVEATEYVSNIGDTFGSIGSNDNAKVLQQGFSSLTERLEAVSSLAVVVSNYEQLKPYEESYGLDNNIYKDTVTFFIPRVIWKEKPAASDPRKYSELYFDFGENSFTVTPMGDLLRNFGVWGVPLGMLFLGFVIRILYSALMENQPFSYWRSVLFFMIVPGVSYEGFFGTIIPYMFKIGFVSLIGLLIIYFLINKRK